MKKCELIFGLKHLEVNESFFTASEFPTVQSSGRNKLGKKLRMECLQENKKTKLSHVNSIMSIFIAYLQQNVLFLQFN